MGNSGSGHSGALSITPATEADTAEISVLLGEIEHYYGGSPAPADPERVRRVLAADPPIARVLLARRGDRVLGFASYTVHWPAGVGTSLFLKELYVRGEARKLGVGRALMAELRALAAANDCSRVEWTADRDNPGALAFYAALGAEQHAGKVFFRAPL